MEELERKRKYCLFCLKWDEEVIPSNERKDIHQFFTMLERHLESYERDSSRKGFLLLEKFSSHCCKDCSRIVSSFCDLYCQMKHLELKISWRIWSLTNIMSSADKVGSRVEGFRNSFRIEDSSVEETDCFENVWTSRKLLINKCARKLRNSYPKLTVRKCDNQPSSSPLSPAVSISNESSQLLDSTSCRDAEANSTASSCEENNLEISEPETTPPAQNISLVVKNLVKTTSVVDFSIRKKSLDLENKMNKQKSSFSCSKCSRIFSTPIQLKFHQYSHLNASRIKDKRTIKKVQTDKNKHSPTEISEHIIPIQTEDTKQKENSKLSNPTEPITIQEQELFQEEPLTELESAGDAVPIVDFELSYCKFDNISSPDLLAGDGHMNDPHTWKASTEPIIEISPVVLAKVDDTKPESLTWSVTSPISNDIFCEADHEVIEVKPHLVSHSHSEMEIENLSPPTGDIHILPVNKGTNQITEKSLSEDIQLSKSPEETTVTHRLRTVHKCSQCCKTFSTKEKQLFHEKTHFVLEDEGDDDMSGNSDEDKSEDDFDPGFENDSDSSSSITDNQDQDYPEDGISSQILNAVDTKREMQSNSSSLTSDNGSLQMNELGESSLFEVKADKTNCAAENKQVPQRKSSIKKKNISTKSKLVPATSIPPPNVSTKGNYSTYECECGLIFGSRRTYRSHRIRIHGNSEPEGSDTLKTLMKLITPKYSCSETNCSEKFALEEELDNHKKQHGKFQCQGCPEVKTFSRDLALHEAIHSSKTVAGEATGKNFWKCFRCDFSCHTKSRYVHHHLTKHLQMPSTIFMCPICRQSFRCLDRSRFKILNRHIKDFHDVSGMDPECVPKCSKCSAYFRTDLQLHTHINVVCKNRCSDCGKIFARRIAYRTHRLKHHVKVTTPLPYKCKNEKCGKAFEEKGDLDLHTSFIHFPGWDSQVKCDICGQQVIRMKLSEHVSAHKRATRGISQSRSICETCGKSFKDKHKLQAHSQSHVEPENWSFSCSICGRKCSTKGSLQSHEKTHKKEKPFVCQVCGVSYAHRHNLRIQMKYL